MESRTTQFIDEDENTYLIHAPQYGPGADPAEEKHHQFIVDHWADLAAAGFLGFKRFGIGTVVIRARDSKADVDHDFQAHTISYVPTGSSWMHKHEAEAPTEWLEDQLQSYDPNASAIVLFANGTARDEAMRAYTVEGTPPPPRAFALSRAQYN